MSSPEEVLSYWFPEEDIFDADRQTFWRQMGWWFQGGREVEIGKFQSASVRC